MKGIKAELKKQGILIPVLCCIFPILINSIVSMSLSTRYEGYLLLHQQEYGLTNWQLILKEQTIVYFSEIIYVVIASLVYGLYKKELKNNAWSIVESSDYRYNSAILSKFAVVEIDLILYLLLNYICVICMGVFQIHLGNIENGLLLRGFVIQMFSGMIIISFFELLICVFKRVSIIIWSGVALMIIDIILYYSYNDWLVLKVPITFISQCYTASVLDMAYIIVMSGLLSSLFLLLGGRWIKRNYELKL